MRTVKWDRNHSTRPAAGWTPLANGQFDILSYSFRPTADSDATTNYFAAASHTLPSVMSGK